MLEIFVLVAMCRYLHRTAKGKGWAGWPFVLLMIFGWFAGGFGGAIGLSIMLPDLNDEFPVAMLLGYLCGVVLSCVGNAIIVAMLPNKATDDDRDYSDRRRRRSADDDDDDDPRDRRGRRDDRDDDDRDDDRDSRRGRRRDDD